MAKAADTRTLYRSAVTGEIITKAQAERNKRESVKETYPKPKRK